MTHLAIVPDLTTPDQQASPTARAIREAGAAGKLHQVQAFTVGGIPAGMASGKPSVMLIAPLPDGSVAVLETSLALLLATADALRARYGDPRGDGWEARPEDLAAKAAASGTGTPDN